MFVILKTKPKSTDQYKTEIPHMNFSAISLFPSGYGRAY